MASSPTSTAQNNVGYNCPSCGTFILYGQFHSCTGAQAFSIQTTVGLVSCLSYNTCKRKNSHSPTEWGKNCTNCARNRYGVQPLLDHYQGDQPTIIATPTPEADLKTRLLNAVAEKLADFDESQLVPGCSILMEFVPETLTIRIGVVDNMGKAQMYLAKADECIHKAMGVVVKPAAPPKERDPSKCFACGKDLSYKIGLVGESKTIVPKCTHCGFENTKENIQQYDEP